MSTHVRSYVERLCTDFGFFVSEVWRDRRLDQVAPLSAIELDICDWAANGPKRRGILAPRGIGKTTLVTATYSCWRLLRDPNCKILVVSKSDGEAKKTVKLVLGWIRAIPFLQHMTPRDGQRKSTHIFDVNGAAEDRTPSMTAKGIEGQIEGTRAHVIIPDDVETDTNTKTLTARDDLDHRVREFSNILYPGPDCDIIYVGTYHHEESVYLKLGGRGYAFRTWPLQYPRPEHKILNLAPIISDRMEAGTHKPDDPVIPHRMGRSIIEERQAEGWTHYAMQNMLICDLGDSHRYPLRLSDLIVFSVNRDNAPRTIQWGQTNNQGRGTRIEDIPSLGFGTDGFYAPIMFSEDWRPFTGTRMWIDPSGRGADKTGYAIVSHLNGYLWVHEVGGLDGGYSSETLEKLATLAWQYRVREINVEDNFGQGMFIQLFAPVLQRYRREPGADDCPEGWAASIEGVRTREQKEVRIINALEPVMSSHRLIVDRRVAANQALQHQLTRVTRQRGCLEHEDELESLAMCVLMWRDVLRQDPVKAADRARDREFDEELRRHREGLTPKSHRWMGY